MFMRTIIAAVAVSLASPAFAQVQASAPAAVPDAARLSAARPVVDKLWPLGTYRRLMTGTMSKMMDGMLGSMFDMKASEMVGPYDKSGKAAKAVGDASLGELAAQADPHFRERMKIMMDVMMTEMIPIMERMEPDIRDSLTKVYAAKFDTRQLAEMNAFFSTPTGAAYADQAMLVMMDPEIMKSIQGFAPELLRAMPAIMAKVEAATKHLPPPPKSKN